MFEGPWNLKCIKTFTIHGLYTFKEGCTYRVKDKFPDDNGNIDKGIWEIVNSGSLFNIGYDVRIKHFVAA